jgi:hypothetical protein
MALFEDVFKGGNIVTSLAIGIGVVLLAPVLKPLVRPVAKSVLKAGIAAYDQGRLALAELNEQAGDMVAEARAEMEEEETATAQGSRRISTDEPKSRARAAQHA